MSTFPWFNYIRKQRITQIRQSISILHNDIAWTASIVCFGIEERMEIKHIQMSKGNRSDTLEERKSTITQNTNTTLKNIIEWSCSQLLIHCK